MPYKSDKQRAWMHINEPGIAARWDKEYGGKVTRKKKLSKKDKQEAAKKRIEKKLATKKGGKTNVFGNPSYGGKY